MGVTPRNLHYICVRRQSKWDGTRKMWLSGGGDKSKTKREARPLPLCTKQKTKQKKVHYD